MGSTPPCSRWSMSVPFIRPKRTIVTNTPVSANTSAFVKMLCLAFSGWRATSQAFSANLVTSAKVPVRDIEECVWRRRVRTTESSARGRHVEHNEDGAHEERSRRARKGEHSRSDDGAQGRAETCAELKEGHHGAVPTGDRTEHDDHRGVCRAYRADADREARGTKQADRRPCSLGGRRAQRGCHRHEHRAHEHDSETDAQKRREPGMLHREPHRWAADELAKVESGHYQSDGHACPIHLERGESMRDDGNGDARTTDGRKADAAQHGDDVETCLPASFFHRGVP
mmetsp:Transcript_21273/g.54838  ORF Transcript_21273/g.54838 Transcript_21273/m.54838 type:complete len:285 (-) Transcript_21273:247-1101(-)